MARLARDYVPAGRRDLRVTRPEVGLFTKGNRSSSYLGRTITPGILAKVGNPANPAPRQYWRPKVSDDATTPARRGGVCPGCGIERPVSGQCNQCW